MVESNRRILQYSNIVTTAITILVNALSNTSLFAEKNVGEVSDSYPTLFTPAGYVFSIWGVIYTLLIIFTVYQFLRPQLAKSFTDRIGGFYALAGFANSVWIVLWVNEYIILSTVMLFVLLCSLIAIYLRLDIGKVKVSLKEKLSIHLPFSIYLGWITVATIANVAVSLFAVNWDGLGLSDVTWTVVMITVAIIVTLAVIFTRGDIGYSFVIIWAFIGIIVKQIEKQSIVLTAEMGVAIIAIGLIIKMLKDYRFRMR